MRKGDVLIKIFALTGGFTFLSLAALTVTPFSNTPQYMLSIFVIDTISAIAIVIAMFWNSSLEQKTIYL